MNTKRLIFALLLTVLSIITISIAVKSCNLTPNPNQKITYEIQKKSDSVAVASVQQPDSSKLRKLQALKLRIAKARFLDSLQRIPHQRR